MAEEDLKRFLHKVEQLNALVSSLEADDERRRLLAACSDHNAVVTLAAEWGYRIGRRWGEEPASATEANNLLSQPRCWPGRRLSSCFVQAQGGVWCGFTPMELAVPNPSGMSRMSTNGSRFSKAAPVCAWLIPMFGWISASGIS